MKQAVSAIVLSVFLFSMLGYVPFFLCRLDQHHLQMVERIQESGTRQSHQRLILSQKAFKELDWHDSREFRYRGAMYDLIRMEQRANGDIDMLVVADVEEDELIAGLNRHYEEQGPGSPTTQGGVKALKFWTPLYFHEPLHLPACRFDSVRLFPETQNSLSHTVIEIQSPPPEFI